MYPLAGKLVCDFRQLLDKYNKKVEHMLILEAAFHFAKIIDQSRLELGEHVHISTATRHDNGQTQLCSAFLYPLQ